MSALRAAFDAGRSQGNDEAVAYEWGSVPGQSADSAFADFMADWETDSKVLRDMLHLFDWREAE